MQMTFTETEPASASQAPFRHHALIAWACALAAFSGGTHARATQTQQTPKVDPRLVGTWEMTTVAGQGTWVLRFEANGKYECTNEGPLNLPGHSGTYEAGGDRWKTESNAGTPWTDGGEEDADRYLYTCR